MARALIACVQLTKAGRRCRRPGAYSVLPSRFTPLSDQLRMCWQHAVAYTRSRPLGWFLEVATYRRINVSDVLQSRRRGKPLDVLPDTEPELIAALDQVDNQHDLSRLVIHAMDIAPGVISGKPGNRSPVLAAIWTARTRIDNNARLRAALELSSAGGTDV